jgi:hypothetical protein
VLFLSLAGTITNNVVNSESGGDGIYIASAEAEANLTVTSTLLTNNSPFKFCCGNFALASVNALTCSMALLPLSNPLLTF